MLAHDERLGRTCFVRVPRPWTGYGPFNDQWREGEFAGVGDSGVCVQFADGEQRWFDERDVRFDAPVR